MKNSVIIYSILTSCIFLSACNNESGLGENDYPDPKRIELSNTELQIADESHDFAANLFSVVHELMTDDPDSKNIAISPLSLNMALAMVWNGANGETKQAIQKAMGMGDYPQSEVNDYFKKIKESFVKTDPTVTLAIANSIWTRQGFSVKNSFYDVNRDYYQAEVREVDFGSPNTPALINRWCSDNTNGLIKEIVKKIPGEVKMYLINALYFKGEWRENFNFDISATKEATFKKEDGNSMQVKMMNQKNKLPYYHDEILSATSLPFGNNAFSMVFMLPNYDVSFSGMLNQLKQPDYFSKSLQLGSNSEIDLYIPKFKIEYEISLEETLEKLGMGIAFTDFADFSGISNTSLCISTVKQKTFVSVDEKGAEAAAVTTIGMIETAHMPAEKVVFRADRPFLFAIRENSTGVVLFMGKIGEPK